MSFFSGTRSRAGVRGWSDRHLISRQPMTPGGGPAEETACPARLKALTPTLGFVIDDEVSERLPHLGGVGQHRHRRAAAARPVRCRVGACSTQSILADVAGRSAPFATHSHRHVPFQPRRDDGPRRAPAAHLSRATGSVPRVRRRPSRRSSGIVCSRRRELRLRRTGGDWAELSCGNATSPAWHVRHDLSPPSLLEYGHAKQLAHGRSVGRADVAPF